jgi:tetratricopeptide (TPR) repeat protein
MIHMTNRRVFIGCSLLLLCLAYSPGVLSGQAGTSNRSEVLQYSEQAQQALQANQPEAAVQAYRAILKMDPSNVDARANLGVIAFVQKDWTTAAAEFREALKLQPSLWKAQALLGLSVLHLGQRAEAANLLSASFPHLQDPKILLEAGLQLAELRYQSGELENAAAILGQLRRIAPTNIDVLYAFFRVHNDLTFQALDSMALAAPGSAQMHLALAEHLVNNGNLAGAVAEYRKALQLNPGLIAAHYELGEALLQDSHSGSNLLEAKKEVESVLSLNPSDADAECMLGKIDALSSNLKSASSHYAQALKLNPQDSCANLELAALLIKQEKTQEALSYLQSAASSDPTNAAVRYRLALLYRDMGRKQDSDREMSAFKELRKVKGDLTNGFKENPTAPEK